jgi:hypothetical protein
MNTSDNIGCLFQIMTVILSLWFGFNTMAGASVEISSPAEAASILVLPPSDELMPFEVQNNAITFSQMETLGKPCYYLMQGQVLDLNGQYFTGFDVYIQMVEIEEVGPEEPGLAYKFEDGTWNSMLPNWQVAYNVWMTLEGSEERISPVITVPGRDCNQNVATINFVQIRPVSEDDI